MATKVNLLDHAPGLFIRALDYLVSPWENLEGLARPLWHDVSANQGNVSMDLLAAAGAYGVAIRAGISWGYQDSFFPQNWKAAGASGLMRTSYHVIYTDQDITAQLDNWYRVHPNRDVLPRVIDLEVSRPDSYAHKAGAVMQMSDAVKARDGVRPWIYSRKNIVDPWLASWSIEDLNAHYWWLAQYLWDRIREHPGDPALPTGVLRNNLILHQTADKKAPPHGSVESYALDYDRWERGNATHMFDWIADLYGLPEVPLTLEQRVERLEVEARKQGWPV